MSRYIKICPIGKGAFGTIYHGKDSVTKRNVAIKEQSEKYSSNEQLEWEYKIYKRLEGTVIHGSPNQKWPQAHALFSDPKKSNSNCLVMDLLGASISSIFKENQCILCPYFTAYIAVHCINLLRTMHSRGILHRDIKPQNVVLQSGKAKFPQIYLIDFGLARIFVSEDGRRHDHYQAKRSLKGTLRYMSKWSHLGVKASRRDDLVSLGYMLVYIASGKLPWLKKSNEQVLRQKMQTNAMALANNVKHINLRHALAHYMLIVESLAYSEKPPYDDLVVLFQDIAQQWQGLRVS